MFPLFLFRWCIWLSWCKRGMRRGGKVLDAMPELTGTRRIRVVDAIAQPARHFDGGTGRLS